jgi:isoquinoline 1-oxidoreductase subunit beta
MGLGADGTPVAYEAKIACDGLWQRLFPWFFAKKKPVDLPMFGLVGSAYGIPNEAGTYVNVPLPVRIGAFRGNNDTHNGFLLETMIDEAAHTTGADPLEYRRRLLSNDVRSIVVLDRAATIAGWGKLASGRHQGIAYLQSEFYRCRLAVIVEVSGTADAVKVERLVGVCDSGLAINPLLAERAVEAGMIFGLRNERSARADQFRYVSGSSYRPGARRHRRGHLDWRRAGQLRRDRDVAGRHSSGQRHLLSDRQAHS